MKKVQKKGETLSYYTTYRGLIDYVENTPRSQRSIKKEYFTSDDDDTSFFGSKNLKEALETAKSGWDAGIKQLDLEDGVLVGSGIHFDPSVVGSVVNMESYLQGQPLNMYDLREEREYNLEPLTIYIHLNYSGGFSSRGALEFCKSNIQLINKYQAKHNVKIVGIYHSDGYSNMSSNYSYEDGIRLCVTIKDFDERFVLNNIAYALHPSYNRRLRFYFLETTDYCNMGYGMPVGNSRIVEYAKKQSGKSDKAIVAPSLRDCYGSYNIDQQITKINF